MDRTDAHVLMRRTLRDRGHVRLSVAVEAAMEELAGTLGGDAETWAVAGILADLDRELAQGNPKRRGAIAAEMLATEGASPRVIEAVRERWAARPGDTLAAALAVATAACEVALRLAGETSLEAVTPEAVGESLGTDGRTRYALERLGTDAGGAAGLCLRGIRRVPGLASGASAGRARY